MFLSCGCALFGCATTSPDRTTTLSTSNAAGVQNCELTKPPPNAVRSTWGASELYFFPPTPGLEYSGCLWMWIVHPDDFIYLESLFRYQRGEPAAYRSKEQRSKGHFVVTECTYESGKVVRRSVQPNQQVSTWDCVDPTVMRSALTEPTAPSEIVK